MNGGIVPVHVTVTVWPGVEGTVMLSVGGVDAKLSHPSDAPAEKRAVAITTRTLRMPEWEVRFFFMGLFLGQLPEVRLSNGLGESGGWIKSRISHPKRMYPQVIREVPESPREFLLLATLCLENRGCFL
jgi:hypothetical protein